MQPYIYLLSALLLIITIIVVYAYKLRKRTKKIIKENRIAFSLVDSTLLFSDDLENINRVSGSFETKFNYERQDITTLKINDVLPNLDLKKVTQSSKISTEAIRKDKSWFSVQIDIHKHHQGAVLRILDTTEQQKYKNFPHEVFDNIPHTIFVKDAKTFQFTHYNKAGEKHLGLKREQIIGKTDFDLFPKEQAEFFHNKDLEVLNSDEHISIEEEPIKTSLGERILHTKKTIIRDQYGEPLYLLGISEDVTEKRQMEKKLEQLAKYDQLTSLANRTTLNDFLAHEIARQERTGHKVACIYLDLNKFKPINDTYGHDIGDEVLVAVSNILKQHTREIDCVARVGGDEFVIILVDIETTESAQTMLDRIITELNKDIKTSKGYLQTGASAGLSFSPDDTSSAHELIKLADSRMYNTKHQSKR